MKACLLAIAILIGASAPANADYVVIWFNLAATKGQDVNDAQAQPGQQPRQPGQRGAGGLGGKGGGGGGDAGGGAPGRGRGGLPGGAGDGGPPGMQQPGQQGMGGMMGGGGTRGMVNQMQRQFGGEGGMMGNGGMGSMMGGGAMRGAQAGSMTSRMSGPVDEDVESNPLLVHVILEVEHSGVKERKNDGVAHIYHKWGNTWLPFVVDQEIEWTIIKVPTVSKRYEVKLKDIKEDDPNRGAQLLSLADWALSHGMIDQVTQLMDEVAKVDSKSPAVAAYVKTKADLEKKVTLDDAAIAWKERLGEFKSKSSEHYTLLYDVDVTKANDPFSEAAADRYLKRLEANFRGFFYWFALKGKPLSVPSQRLVAFLVRNKDTFENQHKEVFDDLPMVADGFYARRENLAVFSASPLDVGYAALKERTKDLLTTLKVTPEQLLKGGGLKSGAQANDVFRSQTMALIQKGMEEESELASVSHEGTRQLLAAVSLLPRSVAIPQWIDFGMASFFDTPKESFWPGVGAVNSNYVQNIRSWESTKKLDKNSAKVLQDVVKDTHFRAIHEGKAKAAETKKARTLAWSLTHFLANKKRDQLLKYYQELASLPRDLEFDDEVLVACFHRAFGLLDSSGVVDEKLMEKLGKEWYSYNSRLSIEVMDVIAQARDKPKSAMPKPGT